MKKRVHQRSRSVKCLGYLDRTSAKRGVEEEEVIAYSCGNPRGRHLQCVEKFVNLYRQGEVLKVTLRRKTFDATVLGYKRHPTLGWVMGVLEIKKGVVKDIAIDPLGYKTLDQLLEIMIDKHARFISLVSPRRTILQISPA